MRKYALVYSEPAAHLFRRHVLSHHQQATCQPSHVQFNCVCVTGTLHREVNITILQEKTQQSPQ